MNGKKKNSLFREPQVMAQALAMYEDLLTQKPPEVIDQSGGRTTFLVSGTKFDLVTRPNGWRLSSKEREHYDYGYTDEDVLIRALKGSKEIFAVRWSFSDPFAYNVSIQCQGRKAGGRCDHNTIIPVYANAIKKVTKDFPEDTSFMTSFLPFAQWLIMSDDLGAQFVRRATAQLPLGYFKAMRRAQAVNMASCRAAYMMAMLSLAAVPCTPDDKLWLGLALSCVVYGRYLA